MTAPFALFGAGPREAYLCVAWIVQDGRGIHEVRLRTRRIRTNGNLRI
jgi:hypothetical protein